MKVHQIECILLFIQLFQPSIATVSGSKNQVRSQVHQHNHHSGHENNLALTSFNASHNQDRPRALQSNVGLKVTIDGETKGFTSIIAYGRSQDDNGMVPYEISSDGTEVTLTGNSWKAFQLDAEYEIKEDTVLEFDFSVEDEAESHLICLDDVPGDTGGYEDNIFIDRCFWLAGTTTIDRCRRDGSSTYWYDCKWHLFPEDEGSSHYVIRVGHFTSYFLGRDIKYIAFISDNDGDKGAGTSTFGNIKLWEDIAAPSLSLFRNGISEALEFGGSYGRSQDQQGRNPYTVSPDNLSVTLKGNSWKYFILPDDYEVEENTVLEFEFSLAEEAESHLICLDDVPGNTGGYEDNIFIDRCFWLAGTTTIDRCRRDGSSTYWYDCGWHLFVEETIDEGGSKHYVLPVGHFSYFLKREIKYIAFISDSDNDGTEGTSTFSNIILRDDGDVPSLLMSRNGVSQALELGGSYGRSQDHHGLNPVYTVSQDGLSVILQGNAWKYFKLSDEYEVEENTVLEFDFSVEDEAESHLICLDDVPGNTGGYEDNVFIDRCFWLAGATTIDRCRRDGSSTYWYDCKWHLFVEETIDDEGESKHYVIHVGHFSYFLKTEIKYIAFISDNDSGDRTEGTSTFSNIKLREDDAPSLTMSRNGVNEALELGGSYGRSQDGQGLNPVYTVSPNSLSLTLRGNAWKYFKLSGDYEVKENTVLEFDFSLVEEAQSHLICLDDVPGNTGGYEDNIFIDRCFWLAGTTKTDRCRRDGSSTYWYDCEWTLFPDTEATVEGQPKHYKIPVGRFTSNFSGRQLKYIAFISDNNHDDGQEGISTFSSIELKDSCQSSSDCPSGNYECVEGAGYCACADNYFGPTCGTFCDDTTCSNDGECDSLGACICPDPWTGETCTECTLGLYGDDCSVECGPANCPDGTCDPDGNCCENICENRGTFIAGSASGCECLCSDLWTGETCTECIPGRYGDDCMVECGPDNCVNGTCDPDGNCVCSGPWTGETCTECTPGRYGDDCMVECGPNNCANGTCDPDGNCVCSGPWTGETCTECIPGRYGDDCMVECGPDNCVKGTCDPDGNCVCSGPWTGETCTECIPGRYGDDCMVECGPDICPAGTCDNNGNCVPNCENNCENGGTLSGGTDCECLCSSPWTGYTCTECIPGRYGDDCMVECGPDSCAGGTCDPNGNCVPNCENTCENGGALIGGSDCECLCFSPWTGDTCTECMPGRYGEDCSKECGPESCPDGTCDDNGSCIPSCNLICSNDGVLLQQACRCICAENWSGEDCSINTAPVDTEEVSTSTNTSVSISLGDVDPDAVEIVDPPLNGNVTVEDDGSLTYLPNPGFQGTDEFMTQTCDENNDCTRMTFQVSVTSPLESQVSQGDDKNLEGLYALISLVLAPILFVLQEPLKRWYDKRYGIDDKATHAASSSSASVPTSVNVKAKGGNNISDIDLESGVQNITSNTKGRPPDADLDSEASEEWSTGDDDENDDSSSDDDSISEEDDDSHSDGDESDSEDEDEDEDTSDEDWEDEDWDTDSS